MGAVASVVALVLAAAGAFAAGVGPGSGGAASPSPTQYRPIQMYAISRSANAIGSTRPDVVMRAGTSLTFGQRRDIEAVDGVFLKTNRSECLLFGFLNKGEMVLKWTGYAEFGTGVEVRTWTGEDWEVGGTSAGVGGWSPSDDTGSLVPGPAPPSVRSGSTAVRRPSPARPVKTISTTISRPLTEGTVYMLVHSSIADFYTDAVFAVTAQAGPATVDPGSTSAVLLARIRLLEQERDSLKALLKTEQEKSKGLEVRLAAAEKRIEELKEELARVTPPTSQSRPAVATQSIAYPSFKVTGLGIIARDEIKLADTDTRATGVFLQPLTPVSGVPLVSVDDTQAPGTRTFSLKSARGGDMQVASLRVQPQGLFWTWNSVSPSGLAEALKQLEGWLRTTFIEVRAGEQVLARYQFAPAELTLALPARGALVPLPFTSDQMRLEKDPPPERWEIAEVDANTLRFSTTGGAFTLVLDPSKGTLAALWEGDATQRIREIDAEVRDWEADNKRLLESKRTTERSDTYTLAEIDRQIAANNARIQKLKEERVKLAALAAVRPAVDVSRCAARVAVPNGIVLCRIKMKN